MQETPLSFIFRPASFADFELVTNLLAKSNLPREKIEEQFNNFLLLFDAQSNLLACAGLEIYGSEGLLRSVAVEKHQNKGLGSLLVKRIEDQAKLQHLREIYLLTETAEDFFSKHRYRVISRDNVPHSIQNSFEYSSSCKISARVMKKSLL